MESPPSCSTRPTFISSPNINAFERRVFSTSLEFLGNEEKSYCDPDDVDSLCDEVDFREGKKAWLPDRIDPPLEFRDTPPTAAFRPRRAFTPPLNSLSPGTSNSSLRLSSSHNSLSVPTANRADDSSFITSAMSHDVLTDFYNVPFDSDIYTMPIDTIRPNPHKKRHHRNGKRRRRHTTVDVETEAEEKGRKSSKRHSTPGPSEPVHMTLQEVRQFLHTLCNGPNDEARPSTESKRKHQRKLKSSAKSEEKPTDRQKKSSSGVKTSISHLLKQTLCNVFRVRKTSKESDHVLVLSKVPPPFRERALPPLPEKPPVPTLISRDDNPIDFAASIEKVKDYGWYWGPISGEAAEKVLSNEPDGSFIVRDSSDHHYIFSLTFRLNGCVRHVRIEHDQGNFSFGSCTKFKSQTIVEFIETAVEHSRSGRYLFFLHRRPILGPMRVQLLHPVSRFKHVQSLQHLCRFVIVKAVRRDLIPSLPLPRRLIDYLSSPQYYSEQLSDQDVSRSTQSLHLLSFLPPN